MENAIEQFFAHLENALRTQSFVKLSLGKPTKQTSLQNLYIKPIETKKGAQLCFTKRYETQDITENFLVQEAILALKKHIETDFLTANLLCHDANFQLLFNKKKVPTLIKTKPTHTQPTNETHNRPKNYLVKNEPYLRHLGITNEQGEVLKNKQDKYRQINKYIEIMGNLVQNTQLPEAFCVADMGSGKGYLTFALYHYLHQVLGLNVQVVGVEMRQNLVDFCNETAQSLGYDQLKFVASTVQNYTQNIDVLIALHACDTATDDAIFKGLAANAALIVCAPCCHKQVRNSMEAVKNIRPITKHGILLERQAELVTDTIRALVLEHSGYKTKVFEFVQTEHTAKNLLITAQKIKTKNPEALQQVQELKLQFGLKEHYLEELLKA